MGNDGQRAGGGHDERSAAAIGLVGCGKSKLSTAAPARDLYTGQLFRKSLAYAEARCSHVYVLSAKHGLVDLDQVVEPYELSLGSMRASERCSWARGVWAALGVLHDLRGDLQSVLVLAGELYAGPLLGAACAMEVNVELLEPLRGLGIGRRLAFLTGAPPWRPRFDLEVDEDGMPTRFVGGA